MKVTVITVCYNAAATLAEALDSVAGQTHPDVEHIVIDGGSTDATHEVVRRHGVRVSRFISEPDRGLYDAMNKGLKLASGELVGFLNADDTYASAGTVAAIVDAAKRQPGADAVYGDLVYVHQAEPTRPLRYWRSGEFTRDRLRFGWMPPHPTFYVRSAVLTAVGPFRDTLRIAADYDFVLRCLNRPGATAVYLPEVLVRMRSGGASNRSLAALLLKSREDLWVLRAHGLPEWSTLIFKNLRKIPQLFRRIQ